jgi:hypothetical protein
MAAHTQVHAAVLEKIERAFARNLVDYVRAVRSVDPRMNAEAGECAGGVMAFMGVDSPLTCIKGAGADITEGDIDAAEAVLRRRGAEQIVFEQAPWTSEHSMDRLLQRGYTVVGAEDVVVHAAPFVTPLPLHDARQIDPATWPEVQRHVNGAPQTGQWDLLTRATALVRDAIRFGILDTAGEWIACAQVFPVDNVALFANDATLTSARCRGA